MIYGGINTLGFYLTKSDRVWDRTKNREEYIAFFMKSYTPSVYLLVGSATTATIQVYDELTEELLGSAENMIVSTNGSLKSISYNGIQNQGYDEGFYSLVITTDEEVYYSDVFGWITTQDDYLKISVTSSNVAINNSVKSILDYTDFEYLVYLKVVDTGNELDTQEKANISNGVSELQYGSTSVKRTFQVLCNEALMVFLGYLRILSGNGDVFITWRGVVRTAKEIEVTKEEVFNGSDLYDVKLVYKNPWETIMMINAV